MRINKIIPLFAIAMGVVLAVASSGFNKVAASSEDAVYYYEFNLSADDDAADLIENWTPISQQKFENSACFADHRACMIKTSAVPVSVPCIQQTNYKDPYVTGVVLEVKNRASN